MVKNLKAIGSEARYTIGKQAIFTSLNHTVQISALTLVMEWWCEVNFKELKMERYLPI